MNTWDSLSAARKEFLIAIGDLFVAYFDGVAGYELYRGQIEQVQQAAARATGKSIKELDSQIIIYGHGDPNDPDARSMLEAPQSLIKARNVKNGHNSIFLARMLIVGVYHLWEEVHRHAVAAEQGMTHKELVADLFGDIRHLRNAIVHGRGIATGEVAGARVLKWFAKGEAINLTSDHIKELLFQLSDWNYGIPRTPSAF